MKTIASSSTQEGIVKVINEYFFSNNKSVDFVTGTVSSPNGILKNFSVTKKRNRYLFQVSN